MDESLIDKISKVIKKPYVADLFSLAVPQKYWDTIFKKIYGNVTTTEIETDYADGVVKPDQYFFFTVRKVFPNVGSVMVYYEGWDGDWVEMILNDRGHKLGYEDANGFVDTTEKTDITESTNKKIDKYLDKVVDFLLRDTTFRFEKKTFGFSPNHIEINVFIEMPLYDDVFKYEMYMVEQWDSAQVTDQEFKYVSDTYGLDWDESQTVFERYVLGLRDIILDAKELKYGQ
jgi:hypothetical protein